MLLQLSHFFLPFILFGPVPTLLPSFTHLSSWPWVIHISSFSSPFPILFLTSPCLFCTYHLCSYSLYLFPHSPSSSSPMITLHVISISVILFLFQLFAWGSAVYHDLLVVCFLFLFFQVQLLIVVSLLFIVFIFFFLDKSL